MGYPEPRKGLVINYKFLWKSDTDKGLKARLSRAFDPRAEMEKFRREMERGKNKDRER